MSNSRTRNRRTAEIYNDHFDILRFSARLAARRLLAIEILLLKPSNIELDKERKFS